MDEAEYWSHLEYRVCREFEGIEEFQRIRLWCDGFVAQDYDLEATRPCIRGTAWICPGDEQQSWEFTLLLNQRPATRHDINWAALLPADHLTAWLSLDFSSRHIQLEPGAVIDEAP